MRAGRRIHKVSVKSPTVSQDATTGQATNDWNTVVCTPYASVEPVGGAEEWRGRKLTPNTSHVLEFPYRSGITTAMRVYYGERVLEILSVIDVGEARRDLRLECRELNT